jgi:hypothetical protein
MTTATPVHIRDRHYEQTYEQEYSHEDRRVDVQTDVFTGTRAEAQSFEGAFVIVLANHKGGVTKTTSTANLGALLAEAALDEAAKRLGVARQTMLHQVQRGQRHAIQVTQGRRQGLRIQVQPAETGLFAQ